VRAPAKRRTDARQRIHALLAGLGADADADEPRLVVEDEQVAVSAQVVVELGARLDGVDGQPLR
jgi:hypothetical protein